MLSRLESEAPALRTTRTQIGHLGSRSPDGMFFRFLRPAARRNSVCPRAKLYRHARRGAGFGHREISRLDHYRVQQSEFSLHLLYDLWRKHNVAEHQPIQRKPLRLAGVANQRRGIGRLHESGGDLVFESAANRDVNGDGSLHRSLHNQLLPDCHRHGDPIRQIAHFRAPQP